MKSFNGGCLVVALAALLGGCSGGGADAGAAMPMALQGVVHGGQAPIVGSAVTLRAASEQGLSDARTVATATTDSNGNFNFTFTCPSPTAQMYVTGSGGNPGGGANSAIHLMSILGPCGSLHRSATLNELTTVAAAYAANAFIGPSGCADCSGGLPASVDNITGTDPGLPNAMGNAALLVSPITGLDAPRLPHSSDCPSSGTVPPNCLTVKKLNTAANALAACVNSSGPTSAQCTQLFDCAVVGAVFTSSTACTPPSGAALPADTLTAMLNIVRNPVKVSIPGIDDTSSRDVVFSPAFTSHFTDYTMSLNLIGDFSSPTNVAIDSAGDIWVSNGSSESVIELGPNGAPLSGSGFATGSIPSGIALDSNDDAWISSFDFNNLVVLSPAGTALFGSPITGGGLAEPLGVAVSPDGDVWVADNGTTGYLSRFDSTGSAIGSGYATGSEPVGVVVDALGYVFVTNQRANTISQFTPAGSLIQTISSGNLNEPTGAAIDLNDNLWVASYGTNDLVEISLSGEAETGVTPFSGGGLNKPSGVATDAAGNIWVVNSGCLSEFNNAGTALSPAVGFIGAGLATSAGEITPAIDSSGNVWVANASNNSLTVFIGAAAPTRTPLVAALTQGFAP